MPAKIFFVVIGGWLLSRWTESSSAFGLVNGRYVFWLRLNVDVTTNIRLYISDGKVYFY